MPASTKLVLSFAALFGAAAVILGAFGAHALRARLSLDMLAVWQTAVQYHFWHALALLAVGILGLHLPHSNWLHAASLLFICGILIFSGSLYLLALGAPRGLGVATPVGGLALILGWIALSVAVLRA
jgi:uncharacterized membrane protein YgdD (TMEM256/DUF423 family)